MQLPAERRRVADAISRLSESGLDGVAAPLLEPVRYALSGDGKRLRPILTLLVYDAAGGTQDIAPLAVAVELIHTYSLVHDDLPCMDDDDIRRGRPALHRRFSAKRAILAGAALIPIAGRTVFRAGSELGFPDEKCSLIAGVLMRSAGAGGMIGGQLRDLGAEGWSLTLEEMESLHSAKTGELIVAAARVGALAADACAEDLAAFEKFAAALGLAFQIMDDVLDATASTATMGKTAGRDAALGKSTYVSLLGVGQARLRAGELVKEGMVALSERALLTAKLLEVANFILARDA